MSAYEWVYLFNYRGDRKSGYATVNGVKGVVFLPDNWTLPSGSLSFSPVRTDFTTNVYTVSDWNAMEWAGAVFLPLAGYRQGTVVHNISGNDHRGHYWTSSAYNTSGREVYACTMGGTQNPNLTIYVENVQQRCSGSSVRLVRDLQ